MANGDEAGTTKFAHRLQRAVRRCVSRSEQGETMSNQQRPDAATALRGLDEFVHATLQEWKGRGVALAIMQDNEVIYTQGYGLRDEAHDLPVTTQTLFPIASCTKAFTTASLAMLADQGKLDWDAPV